VKSKVKYESEKRKQIDKTQYITFIYTFVFLFSSAEPTVTTAPTSSCSDLPTVFRLISYCFALAVVCLFLIFILIFSLFYNYQLRQKIQKIQKNDIPLFASFPSSSAAVTPAVIHPPTLPAPPPPPPSPPVPVQQKASTFAPPPPPPPLPSAAIPKTEADPLVRRRLTPARAAVPATQGFNPEDILKVVLRKTPARKRVKVDEGE